MRKLMLFAVGLVALATAGIAVAHGIEGGAKSAKAVAGTFSATTASKTSTRSCTTTEGKTIEVSQGRWTGAATGDPDLTGPITIEAKSTINTTDGVGVVEGALRIDVASGRDTRAAFSTVYDHGKVAGLAAGKGARPLGTPAREPVGRLRDGDRLRERQDRRRHRRRLGPRAGPVALRTVEAVEGEERGTRHRNRGLPDLDHCRGPHLRRPSGSRLEGRRAEGERPGRDPLPAGQRHEHAAEGVEKALARCTTGAPSGHPWAVDGEEGRRGRRPSPFRLSFSLSRAHSSAGERSLHTREVPGSIPGAPTPSIARKRLEQAVSRRPDCRRRPPCQIRRGVPIPPLAAGAEFSAAGPQCPSMRLRRSHVLARAHALRRGQS